MKRTILAVSLMAAFGTASAAGLTWTQLSTNVRTETFNPVGLALGLVPDYGGGAGAGSTVSEGYLSETTAGAVKYTVLGQESGFLDNLHLNIAPFTTLQDNAFGATATAPGQAAGILNFSFEGNNGSFATNGFKLPYSASSPLTGWCPTCSIGLIATNKVVAGVRYEFIIGYNDSAGTSGVGDWDDMVVGVNAIPEPESYAMMLAGLGLMGFIARRRRQRNVIA